jgi:transcriptional regulator with GAF, ATPase, and Fis domain
MKMWRSQFCADEEQNLEDVLNELEREGWTIFAVNTTPETEGSRFGHTVIAWRPDDSRPLADIVDDFERGVVRGALEKTRFNQTKAAVLLQTTRRVLRYRIEKLQIAKP